MYHLRGRFPHSFHVSLTQRPSPLHSAIATPSRLTSSSVWNWLTLNELLHVEHHDFCTVPWTQLPSLTQAAPEFYLPAAQQAATTCEGGPSWGNSHPTLKVIGSLYGDLILPWLWTRGRKFDFACREASVFHIVNRMRMAEQVRQEAGLPPLTQDEDEGEEEDGGTNNVSDDEGEEVSCRAEA
jgi:hypothetical protein